MGSRHKRKREGEDSGSTTDDTSAEEDRKHKSSVKKHKKDKKKAKSEKKLLKEAKKYLKRQVQEGNKHNSEEDSVDVDYKITEIDSDSYFEKNPEFTAWLSQERGIFFNDLPSRAARQLFDDFVNEWNSKTLKKRYYAGISPSAARRSQHSWSIQGGGVGGATKLGMAAAFEEEQEARDTLKDASKVEKRRWKADQKMLLDELLPKPTGRDAAIEKRQLRKEEKSTRETSPDITHLPGGGDVLGGDDSFATAKAREQKKTAWKEREQRIKSEVANAKLREAEIKEQDSMAQFRALAARGPITIPKRA